MILTQQKITEQDISELNITEQKIVKVYNIVGVDLKRVTEWLKVGK